MKLKELHLKDFKSFADATLHLGGLTLLLGANASGKSNLRDALRFLHGIGRGYTLAEILGGKYSEGVPVWTGIRGGSREIAHKGGSRFGVSVSLLQDLTPWEETYAYRVTVVLRDDRPRIESEALEVTKMGKTTRVFDAIRVPGGDALDVRIRTADPDHTERLSAAHSALSQLAGSFYDKETSERLGITCITLATALMSALGELRFLDLSPDAMRLPSIPGETHLSDRGENLSSVLHGLCEDPKSKKALASWIGRLTPMDVVGFEFPADAAGKILVHLVEQDGRKTSAYSASDGTLRFLGMLAAMLGPDSGKTFVFEELDNGIHPARLNLLMALLRKRTREADLQVIATTHSPQLVRLLGDALADASITYRQEGTSATSIRRLSEIAGIAEALKVGDLADLHESSWFEDAISFARTQEAGK